MPPKKTELPVTHTRPCCLRNLLPGVEGRGVVWNWGKGRGVRVCVYVHVPHWPPSEMRQLAELS